MIIVGIETSCDETAVAVLKNDRTILSDLLSSQIDLHEKYGGIVPELACRRHIEVIGALFNEALDRSGLLLNQIDAIAVTVGPGLIGALLVGVSFAKSLAYSLGIPFFPVHHLEGHINAVFIEHPDIEFPVVALVVSGGHTNLYYMPKQGEYRLLGKTVDDAAGEALDKGARMLGYGYPGGPIIDRLAKKGDPMKIPFPIPMRSKDHYDFSFSGLKTALRQKLTKYDALSRSDQSFQADLAAGYQFAVVESLIEKTFLAVEREKACGLIVCGGVAANSLLRLRIKEESIRREIPFFIPSPRFCTDNGAMIAMVGILNHRKGNSSLLELNPNPNLQLI
ncbi:tRNA (adenosine(37)-N6)-threonylcarbamoyltransferase complex transferase subunit TsaD [Nitrospira defluvii]|nr:tRNA (adenosine(37)-N6)-threonylcarbamoyltransferase complex transferase subunit TsaD [Nitrospira defluvii]